MLITPYFIIIEMAVEGGVLAEAVVPENLAIEVAIGLGYLALNYFNSFNVAASVLQVRLELELGRAQENRVLSMSPSAHETGEGGCVVQVLTVGADVAIDESFMRTGEAPFQVVQVFLRAHFPGLKSSVERV